MDQLPNYERTPVKPWSIRGYEQGYYMLRQSGAQPVTAKLMFPKAIQRWEEANKRQYDGKAWGMGQELRLLQGGGAITFGRDVLANVVISVDPSQDGTPILEPAVSRNHFSLRLTDGNQISITDLGSTNGTKLYDESGKLHDILDEVNPNGILKEGYCVTVGGRYRLVGFRVCRDNKGLFLVKFTGDKKEFKQMIDDINSGVIRAPKLLDDQAGLPLPSSPSESTARKLWRRIARIR